MSFRVSIAGSARRQMWGLHAAIAAHSPANADQVVLDILDRVTSLERMPRRLAAVALEEAPPAGEYRAFVVDSIRVIYRIEHDHVTVLDMRHAAQHPPTRGELRQS